MMKLYTGIIFVFLFFSCAVQAPPSGGPVDKTPPAIISFFPPPDTINVDVNTDIFIEFSEQIDKSSLENSLFVSPVFGEKFKIKWRKRKAFLIPPEKLKKDVTYVFNIGTDVKDLRNNHLKNSLSWAFSTGNKINKGKISGSIIGDRKLSGCFIWCFKKEKNKNLNPALSFPDYITQTGDDGKFSLNCIAKGTYRVFAFRDVNDDKKFTPETDPIGIPPEDIYINDSEFQNLNLWIAKVDTIPPDVEYISVLDRNKIEISFSEAIEIMADSIFKIFTENNRELKISNFYSGKNKNSIVLETDIQKENEIYHLKISGLSDLRGNFLFDPGDSLTFLGTATPDTVSPEILSFSPQDSSSDISCNTPISIVFSEPVDTTDINNKISLYSLSDSVNVDGKLIWLSPVEMNFVPSGDLKSQKEYIFSVELENITDKHSNKFQDSLFQVYFITENRDLKGSIIGTIVDSNRFNNFSYHLIITNSTGGKVFSELKINKPGKFNIPYFNTGQYKILVYKDLDNNGRYSFGKLSPFTYSEPFIKIDQPVEIRAGWDTEIGELIFKY